MPYRTAAALIATTAAFCSHTALAQNAKISDGVIKVGVIEDMSGVYADITGKNRDQFDASTVKRR